MSGVTGNAILDEEAPAVRVPRPQVQRGQMRNRILRAGFAGACAVADAQLRPALGCPVAVPPGNNNYSTATVEDILGVSGVGNLFKPGVLTGRPPQFVRCTKAPAYQDRLNNFAPSLGFAWRPAARQAGGAGETRRDGER